MLQASRSFSITQSMSTSDTQENSLNKCRFRDWVVAVRRLSGELSKHLSDTFKTCERYCARHAYFLDLPRERGGLPLFQALQILLNRLDQQRNRLEALSEECKEFAQDVRLQ
jgi:hypothetical protein